MSNDLGRLPKLKPSIKKRWLKALRSGEYEQSQFALRTPTGYCCLGVLADVVKDDLGMSWEVDDADRPSIDDRWGVLGVGVLNHILLSRPVSSFNALLFDPLTRRNDGRGDVRPQSFKQIANIIERHC